MQNILRNRSAKVYGGSAILVIGVAILASASVAFACTTYQGKLTVTAGGSSSISDGTNNCDSGTFPAGCGLGDGSMTFCVAPTLAAHMPASGGTRTATVAMATTTSCTGSKQRQSSLAGNVTYDINYINLASDPTGNQGAMSAGDVSINGTEDCMTWNTSANLLVRQATDSGGAFSTSVSLPTGQTADSAGWYAGICVSSSDSKFGNQAGLRFS